MSYCTLLVVLLYTHSNSPSGLRDWMPTQTCHHPTGDALHPGCAVENNGHAANVQTATMLHGGVWDDQCPCHPGADDDGRGVDGVVDGVLQQHGGHGVVHIP